MINVFYIDKYKIEKLIKNNKVNYSYSLLKIAVWYATVMLCKIHINMCCN